MFSFLSSRYPHAKDRIWGLWASLADFSSSVDLPSVSDPARLHPCTDNPHLDDEPAESTLAHTHTHRVVFPSYLESLYWLEWIQSNHKRAFTLRGRVFTPIRRVRVRASHSKGETGCFPTLTSSPSLLSCSLVCCWDRSAFQHYWPEWVEKWFWSHYKINQFNQSI